MNNDCSIVQKSNLSINNRTLQSIEILQMDSDDITQLLNKAAEDNPFIEVTYNRQKSSSYKNAINIENLTGKIDLKTHLIEQINISGMSDIEKKIARYITFLLNEDGYITISKKEVAISVKISLSTIEQIFKKLYSLDPVGVYSQNLSECLSIQLINLGYYDNIYEQILDKLSLIRDNKIKKLSELLNLQHEELLRRLEVIKKLNPCPGQLFNINEVCYLKPELNVYIDEANNIMIEPFEYHDSFYHVNEELYQSLEYSDNDKSTRKYYNEHYKYAKWLLRVVENRNNTLMKVARAIAEEQYEFFQEGVGSLKPLILKNIAKKIEMHESTISRVTNKSIMTKFGVFRLKYFFSSEIKSLLYENTYSSTAIKEQIKKLIYDEDNKTPLSDRAVTEILNVRGIKISRRTVAKYREEMKITDSYRRIDNVYYKKS